MIASPALEQVFEKIRDLNDLIDDIECSLENSAVNNNDRA